MKFKFFEHSHQDLEKRIFISYFLFTFFLIGVLLLIEWQLASFGISQNEEININNYLTAFNIGKNSDKLIQEDSVTSFSGNQNVVEAVRNKNVKRIRQLCPDDLETLVICSREREIWYGIRWELIDRYLPQIFRQASQNRSGSFITALDRKLYLISFSPCLTETLSEMVGICIVSKRIDISSYKINSIQRTILLPYGADSDLSMYPEPAPISNSIKSAIQNLIEAGKNDVIVKINRDYAIGVSFMYDLEQNPTSLFLVIYQRFVNSFVQQSVLLFILILIAVSTIMLSLLGSWFSRAILSPVKNLSKRMKEIASHPADLGGFPLQYTGVLGEMVISFNGMNAALIEHSKTLREYKFITDNIQSGIFWLDADYNVVLCNPSFIRIVEGNDFSDVSGKNLNRLLDLKKDIKSSVIAGINTFSDLQIEPNKGRKKYVILNIRVEGTDEQLRFLGSITDITAETQAIKAKEALELELIKSNKMAEIGRNVEGIVHNLNSPLNSILGYSQLILRNNPEIKDIDKILDAGKMAAHIVKGLLDRVKKSNASMIHPVNINEVVEQELELCRHNLFYKHFVISEKELQPRIPSVMANFGDMSLAIANILNNAFDAMKDSLNKTLHVQTEQKGDYVLLTITDSGIGIPKANLKKIFEVNFSTKNIKGETRYGLGLAITKQIIEKYNGTIEVSSKVGAFSTFTISLPVLK